MWFFKIIKRRGRRRVRRGILGGFRKEYLKHRETARTLAHERLEFFNANYGFAYKKVAIRNQKSRWGSCSKAGNLNFNYRLILLPPPLVDYVIVHELCHLTEFNHSKNFWALVAQTVPDHVRLQKELKQVRLKGSSASGSKTPSFESALLPLLGRGYG